MKKVITSFLVLALLPTLNSCGGLSPSGTQFFVGYAKAADPTLCPGGLVGTFTIDGRVVQTQTVAPQTDFSQYFDNAPVRQGAVYRVEGRCLAEGGATLLQNSRQGIIKADFKPFNATYIVTVALNPTTVSSSSDPDCMDSVTAKPNPICIRTLLN